MQRATPRLSGDCTCTQENKAGTLPSQDILSPPSAQIISKPQKPHRITNIIPCDLSVLQPLSIAAVSNLYVCTPSSSPFTATTFFQPSAFISNQETPPPVLSLPLPALELILSAVYCSYCISKRWQAIFASCYTFEARQARSVPSPRVRVDIIT